MASNRKMAWDLHCNSARTPRIPSQYACSKDTVHARLVILLKHSLLSTELWARTSVSLYIVNMERLTKDTLQIQTG